MGYMRHHAILVTSWDGDRVAAAGFAAMDAGCSVTEIVGPTNPNGYYTFVATPDGSKEGWSESLAGDRSRDQFVQWLRAQVYEDGSSPFAWAEVQYGDDDGDDRVVQSSARSALDGG
jgi:hypothetical protein